MSAEWYHGACDRVLASITSWLANYEKGEPFSDREWLDPVDMRAKQVTVKFCHRVQFWPGGLEHLVRIVTAIKPDWPVTKDFQEILRIVRGTSLEDRRRLLNYRVGTRGVYTIDLAFYKQDVWELRELLLEVKTGKKAGINEAVLQQTKQGKAPFEVE